MSNNIKNKYPKGTKIRLLKMEGEPQMPYGLTGIVKFVDDTEQIHVSWENGSSLALNINKDNFEIIPKRELKVLFVEPMKTPQKQLIDGSLEGMQKIVGGLIETFYLPDDEAVIICNEEGKISDMPLNRGIFDNFENPTELIDIIAGPFFICLAPETSEHFESLTDELIEKYDKLFHYPETFYKDDEGNIRVLKIK